MNIERAADILYKAENERRQVAMLSQDNPDTVSYTHLDVYKRQTLAKAPSMPATATTARALISGSRLLNSCLLYTSRCV